MMGQSAKVFAKWFSLTSSAVQGKSLNQERGQDKENIRKTHEQLCMELNSLQREYKHVRQVVYTLQQDYERSKDFDPLRRYGLLKGMIKRTILHFKLNEDKVPGSISMTGIRSLANGYKELSYTLELTRRKADLDDMSLEQIGSEVEQLRHQVNGLKGRCSLVSDTVSQLENKYEQSKNFAPPKRYELMKKMVQKVVNDQFI
ncbi:uncharacterized protein LOC133189611 [Saccostrea echinata]|uniref:uncharacterized protein LOC133189611 n=1 Tax=Saccostrea echinata TaxID=191078 RepID=UPI002A8345CA|nr:uncharacterized protein LOC133189611 [Saccostrea echinata]